ncbi:hypothetical protein GPECTOR_58g533 [Gonium pectorale]|uniref:Protein kinase domain-containing protein n=1 Tax=Gonium pectorale TaxID=33097 RepID=A0A150G6C6_GONPE|nr:hypothetical protein GPECTOR_58g533 [Gonium pectorale]|eukprot:KXZ45085.1 hypothetical protein GPECTOR_58g533 [Gonium pectorale]
MPGGGLRRPASAADLYSLGSSTAAVAAAPPPQVWYAVQEQACGTVTHMAPEAMKRNSRIDASVDVFAFGVIMWELLCGRGSRPYARLSPEDIPRAVTAGLRPSFSDDVPAAFRRLAQACWSTDPANRPRMADVVISIKAQLAAVRAAQASAAGSAASAVSTVSAVSVTAAAAAASRVRSPPGAWTAVAAGGGGR